MSKKAGSDGQIRKTTAEWAADTKTYLEGMRLMDTTTGTVRVSKGTTYALAWQPSAGSGASAWGDITGTLSNQADLVAALLLKAGAVRDYAGSLVVNPGDLIQRSGVLYYSVAVQFTTSNWGADSSSFTEIGITTAVMNAALATFPLRYKFTGDGGAATGTVVANTLGVTINVTNPAPGQYRFTAASGTPFTAGKTTISVQNKSDRGAWRFTDSVVTDTTECRAFFADVSETGADPVGYEVIIEVEP